MNIHEYQAKEILKKYGVAVQEGFVAETPEQALEAAQKVKEHYQSDWCVVKAQIHDLLGGTLVTIQTGAAGKLVSKVLVAQDVFYPGASEPKEYYMSVLLDRATKQNVIIYTTEGGMDIEEVAEQHPEKIHKEWVNPAVGLQAFQARKIAFNLGLEGKAFKEMVTFVTALYRAYDETDSAMFEINPVLKTSDDRIIAVDAKVNLDDNALYRHKDFLELRDLAEEDPTEVEAGKFNLNYVKLDGNVGCMVNGAGLAMATMDIIKLSGDVGSQRESHPNQHIWWYCSLRSRSQWRGRSLPQNWGCTNPNHRSFAGYQCGRSQAHHR